MKVSSILLTLLLPFVVQDLHALKLPSFKRVMAVGSALSIYLAPTISFAAEDSLVEQLKVVRALQIEQQKEEIIKERDDETRQEQTYEKGKLIARGLVALPAVGATDPSLFPFGFTEATALDEIFGSENAALILTAVSKQGPPVAAKRLPLKQIKFPLVFEITTDDLLFPYNADIWKRSPLSEESISVTCILEPDGRLGTAEAQSRFGFAISDPIKPREPIAATTETVVAQPLRTDAKISVNMKADGRPYSEEEKEMLSRVDAELDRISSNKNMIK